MSRELLYLQEVGANVKGFSWTVVYSNTFNSLAEFLVDGVTSN